ncbi:ATP-grasp domain-containing protein [Streptomyces sp. NPDC001435]|uniref:ATP-grasp domain-containing protein n=1 Tax=Streptomyces sp. NPDC001435 TaxID=3364576 RepID=UPI0036A9FEAA
MKADGLDLLIINLRADADLTERATAICQDVRIVDFGDISGITQMVREMHSESPFSMVVCHAEALQMIAGHLTSELGLPGNSFEIARIFNDKFATRSLLRKHGLSRAASAVVTCADELTNFVDTHGTTIIKPRGGSGSWGVRLVRDAAEAEAAWNWVTDAGLAEMLAEVFLVGTEISVESFSVDGQHIPLAATTKELSDGFIEMGHAVPAPISSEDLEACHRLVSSLLDIVGLTWGPSHTEIILTSSGPEIVESHCRRAGGHINELVRLVYGIDMEYLVFELAAGQKVSLTRPPAAQQSAAIRFLTAEAGIISGVSGVEQLTARNDVAEVEVSTPGRRSYGLRWGGDYVGHLITLGNSPTGAMDLARELETQIEITILPDGDASDNAAQIIPGEALDSFVAAHAVITATRAERLSKPTSVSTAE